VVVVEKEYKLDKILFEIVQTDKGKIEWYFPNEPSKEQLAGILGMLDIIKEDLKEYLLCKFNEKDDESDQHSD